MDDAGGWCLTRRHPCRSECKVCSETVFTVNSRALSQTTCALPCPPQAATLRGHPLYRVTGTEVLADTRNGKWKSSDHR